MASSPPRLANRLLRAALDDDDFEALLGDLEEAFRIDVLPRDGPVRARVWYRRQVISIVGRQMVRSTHDADDVAPRRHHMEALRQDLGYAVGTLIQAAGLHHRGDPHARARHRRERRDLLAGERRALQAVALRRTRSADGASLVEARSRRRGHLRPGRLAVPRRTIGFEPISASSSRSRSIPRTSGTSLDRRPPNAWPASRSKRRT